MIDIERVYNAIGIGEKNRTTRTQIALKTGYDDRSLRKAIEELTCLGYIIVSSSHHKGYYRVTDDDVEAVKQMIKENRSRIAKLSQKNKVYERWLESRADKDQVKLDG